MPKWLDSVTDQFWPRITGAREPVPPIRDLGVPIGDLLLEALDDAISKREARVDERNRSVDGKLLGVLSLASILSALLTLGLTVVVSARLNAIPGMLFAVVVALVIYISAQMLCALRATVIGLKARGYKELRRDDVDPLANETAGCYRRRQLSSRYNNIWFNEWAINGKVSHMNVATKALQNAEFGAGCVILAGASIAVARRLGWL
jgi:hypothetical protein